MLLMRCSGRAPPSCPVPSEKTTMFFAMASSFCLQSVKRSEGIGLAVEEMAAQFWQLFAGLGEAAILHFDNPRGIIHCVAARRNCLVDAPDCAMIVAIAGDNL